MSSEANAASAPKKKGFPLGALLRGGVGIAILVIVFTRVPFRDLQARFAHVQPVDIGMLVFFGALQMSTGAGRWWRLLHRLGERPTIGAVWRDLLVGSLFNTFLPTSFGGDFVRALRMSRRLGASYHAWSSSFFERLVGMLTLALAGAFGVVLLVGDRLPARLRIIVIVMTLVFAIAFFFAAAPLRLLVSVLERRLPARFIADVRGVVVDLEGPLATTGARLETFAWSAVGFGCGVVYVFAGARAFGAPEHALAIAVGIPIISVLSLAPVSLGGHGLREGLYVVVLGVLGVPKDVALALALLALAYSVLFALSGGVVALFEPTAPITTTAAEGRTGARVSRDDPAEN